MISKKLLTSREVTSSSPRVFTSTEFNSVNSCLNCVNSSLNALKNIIGEELSLLYYKEDAITNMY